MKRNSSFIIRLVLLITCCIIPLFICSVPHNVSAQWCRASPQGIYIQGNNPNNLTTDQDIVTLTWWWWDNATSIFYPPPNTYCDEYIPKFEITVIDQDYSNGIQALLIENTSMTLTKIPTSFTFNLSQYVVNRVYTTFGILIRLWNQDDYENYPFYQTFYARYEIHWYPQPIVPHYDVSIPDYVYVVIPILTVFLVMYYIYWRTTCKNSDNFDEEKCAKERNYIVQKGQQVKQEQENEAKQLFGESQ